MSDMIASVEATEVRPAELPADLLDEQLIGQLVDRARASGLQLTGEGGLLQQLTKRVLESALEGEITDHLGYEKHDRRVPAAATAATASVPRPCSRTSARSRSPCLATGRAASSRRSSRSASVD